MTNTPFDKDLQQLSGIETAHRELSRKLAAPALAVAFLLSMAVWAAFSVTLDAPLLEIPIAAALAGYMALNIGANDVSNNMGPVVGARALPMLWALAIAAAFEAAGALLAGEQVVKTIAVDLLESGSLGDPAYVRAMLSALLAGALWINLATWFRAPISTTHAIVGGALGAGIVAGGAAAVSWPIIGTISLAWIVSPILGGCLAAIFLHISRRLVTDKLDKLAAARIWVPIFVAILTGVFSLYLLTEVPGTRWAAPLWLLVIIGPISALLAWLVAMPWVRNRSLQLENRKKQVSTLFRPPLIVSAAFFSFGHGANDVSNAVGPLAAIVTTLTRNPTSFDLGPVPFWVLAIGAFGISLGLALFGPRLIRTVGEQITRLNEIRAACAALAAAITVLLASAFGLPVSSTHVAVGALFGLGFLREWSSRREMRGAAIPRNARYVDPSQLNDRPEQALARAREIDGRRLVRRSHLYTIMTAWLVTLPACAGIGAIVYLMLSLIRL